MTESANSASRDEGTQLARERTFVAFERTLMAWLRTSLSMISFGFTLVKFFEFLSEERGRPVVGTFGRTWAPTTMGMAMIIIGTGALVVAVIQHRRRVEALRREGLVSQMNLAWYVAILVAVLGVYALFAVVV